MRKSRKITWQILIIIVINRKSILASCKIIFIRIYYNIIDNTSNICWSSQRVASSRAAEIARNRAHCDEISLRETCHFSDTSIIEIGAITQRYSNGIVKGINKSIRILPIRWSRYSWMTARRRMRGGCGDSRGVERKKKVADPSSCDRGTRKAGRSETKNGRSAHLPESRSRWSRCRRTVE